MYCYHTENDLSVATSENGWTDDFVGFEWFKQGFVPKATARNKSGAPILLIYDGHGSHTTLHIQRIVFSLSMSVFLVHCNMHGLFDVTRSAFKSETILKAWRKAGIRPINPDIFTEADYAPSYSTSTQMHVPPSFPRKMPSVPDASSDDGFFDPRTLAKQFRL